jgi:putative flippase GtrA
MWKKLLAEGIRLARAGGAGLMATLSDLAVLTLLVSVVGLDPKIASFPALLVGGLVNFFANRHFAFKAANGHVGKQALGYTVVEIVALALNAALYDFVLRTMPVTAHAYWLVRLATSHLVFLLWSYPLWRRVFRVKPAKA